MFLFAKDKQTTSLYVLYIVSLIMNVVPNITISSFGALLFLVVFVGTYILKFTSKKESTHYSHYAYLTKTIWIFTLFVMISMVAAYYFGDHTIINNMVSSVTSGNMVSVEQMSMAIMDYANANKYVFGLIFLPVTVHLFYRLGKGLYLARKDEPIPNPKSWL